MQFSNLCIHLATVCGPDVILDTGNYIVKKHRDVPAIIFFNIPVGGHRERKQDKELWGKSRHSDCCDVEKVLFASLLDQFSSSDTLESEWTSHTKHKTR